jgi:hypothetical protein
MHNKQASLEKSPLRTSEEARPLVKRATNLCHPSSEESCNSLKKGTNNSTKALNSQKIQQQGELGEEEERFIPCSMQE